MVDYLTHNPTVDGLCVPVILREKMAKKFNFYSASANSTVADYLTHNPTVDGLSLTNTSEILREKRAKKLNRTMPVATAQWYTN